jgi:hypothetical protein
MEILEEWRGSGYPDSGTQGVRSQQAYPSQGRETLSRKAANRMWDTGPVTLGAETNCAPSATRLETL